MTWIAIDCDLFDHPKMAALPNDSARYGWLIALSKAKRQRNAGAFASEQHFAHVLGRYGRFAGAYIKAGLLDRDEDGGLHIHDWRKHQWAASKARLREEEEETSGGPDVDTNETESGLARASRAVAVPVDVSSTGVGSGAGGLIRLVETLTNRPFGFTAGSRPWQTLTEDVQALGAERVAAAYRETAAEAGHPLDAAGVIYGGHKRLFPIPGSKKSDPERARQDAEEAARIAYDKRVEKTRREIEALRS